MAAHFILEKFSATVKSRGAQNHTKAGMYWPLLIAESTLHTSLTSLWLKSFVQESTLPLDESCNPVHAWRFNRANTIFQVRGCLCVLCILLVTYMFETKSEFCCEHMPVA